MTTRAGLLLIVVSMVGCASGGGDVATPPTTDVTVSASGTPTGTGPLGVPPPTSAPNAAIDDTCRINDDCALEDTSDDTCCATCDARAMTRSRMDALYAKCVPVRTARGHGDCPSLDCPNEPMRAVCRDGRCVSIPD